MAVLSVLSIQQPLVAVFSGGRGCWMESKEIGGCLGAEINPGRTLLGVLMLDALVPESMCSVCISCHDVRGVLVTCHVMMRRASAAMVT